MFRNFEMMTAEYWSPVNAGLWATAWVVSPERSPAYNFELVVTCTCNLFLLWMSHVPLSGPHSQVLSSLCWPHQSLDHRAFGPLALLPPTVVTRLSSFPWGTDWSHFQFELLWCPQAIIDISVPSAVSVQGPLPSETRNTSLHSWLPGDSSNQKRIPRLWAATALVLGAHILSLHSHAQTLHATLWC